MEWTPIDARESDGDPPSVDLVGHLEPGWGHRLRSVVCAATRRLGLEMELAEITVAVANRKGVPDDLMIATSAEEIVVRPSVMTQPDEIRLPYLTWGIHDVVVQHSLIRRGVDPRHPFGMLLLQIAGAWAQQRFLVDDGFPIEDPFDLDTFTGELEAREDLFRLGRLLGQPVPTTKRPSLSSRKCPQRTRRWTLSAWSPSGAGSSRRVSYLTVPPEHLRLCRLSRNEALPRRTLRTSPGALIRRSGWVCACRTRRPAVCRSSSTTKPPTLRGDPATVRIHQSRI